MSFHPGACMYPVKFPYTPEAIREIPVTTIRKFGHTGWDERFYWNEGDRVRLMQNEGKRILGTYTMGDNSQWATMSDADWARRVTLYMDNLSIRGVEVGNEIGGPQAADYLPKLKIASDIIRAKGGWVMMGSPFPGGEAKVWDAAQRAGAWAWVDGVACHPYARTPEASVAKVKAFRDKLVFYGGHAAKLGLHLTEFGWPTAGPPTNPFVVDEATQASYVAEAFKLLRANANALKVNNCLLYTYGPDGYGPDYGVTRRDGSHKPSYAALAAT